MKPQFPSVVLFVFLAACSPSDSEQVTASADRIPPPTTEHVSYTYILVHGATGGGWDWKTVDGLLTAKGHEVYRPTLTSLSSRRE